MNFFNFIFNRIFQFEFYLRNVMFTNYFKKKLQIYLQKEIPVQLFL